LDLLVTDFVNDSIVRVDPETGNQSLVSSGGFLTRPMGIAMENAANVIVNTVDQPSLIGPGSQLV
jgi:hypothetical protein